MIDKDGKEWVMVPKVATPEMVAAAHSEISRHAGLNAAISAAPRYQISEQDVERSAVAAWQALNGPWDFCSEVGKDACRIEARAAIRAFLGDEA